MKTLGQIAQEAFDAAPHDHTKTFDKQGWWDDVARAVRAAVIEECAKECDKGVGTNEFNMGIEQFHAIETGMRQAARMLRSLK